MTILEWLAVTLAVGGFVAAAWMALVRLKSSARTAREEEQSALLKVVTAHRDELQSQVDRQNIVIAQITSEMKGYKDQVSMLTEIVSGKADVASLAETLIQQHREVLQHLVDLAGLLGGARPREQT